MYPNKISICFYSLFSFRELTNIMQIGAILSFMLRFNLYFSILLVSCNFNLLNSQTVINYDSSAGYHFSVDGLAYEVKGVAGEDHLDALKKFGGNTIRTWSIDKKTLDNAHRLGLKVVAGIWVQHMRHDYDYNDKRFILKQRKKVKSIVKKFKDHPALLAWGLGNEVELHVPDDMLETIWGEMETLAKIVKSLDSEHPVMSAVAGFDADKINHIQRYYPSIDILGVNAYGFAPEVGGLLLKYGWEKPYMITEFGPMGPWEVKDKSDWGVAIEETSHEKAKRYQTAFNSSKNESPLYCLGTFPFYWDSKQETTSTWFGMFLKNGSHLEAVDVMAYSWNGHYPLNRVPEIHSIESSAKLNKILRNSIHTASISTIDHENNTLKYRWVIMEESKTKSVGGDFERTPKSYPRLILENKGSEVKFKAPRKKGPYRLFVYVEDDNQGAATANFPFYVH